MRSSRLNWTTQEQEFLKKIKESGKFQSWRDVADQLNRQYCNKNRSAKQCRERYLNYVRFNEEDPKITTWTKEQDQMFFTKFMAVGSRWAVICQQLPGRSQNCLKNRFYGLIRKLIRKIDRSAKQLKIKNRKILRIETIIKILEQTNTMGKDQKILAGKQDKNYQFFRLLSNDLISYTTNADYELTKQEIQLLILRIRQFSNMFRGQHKRKGFNKKKGKKQLQVFGIAEEGLQKLTKQTSVLNVKSEQQSKENYNIVDPIQARQQEKKIQWDFNELIFSEKRLDFPLDEVYRNILNQVGYQENQIFSIFDF